MGAPWNVLEWGRKGKFSYHRESFGIEREREREREREWSSLECFERGRIREKRKIKEGGRDSGHVCQGKKQKKKKKKRKETYGWKWNEERKNNIKNKKILIEKCYRNIFTINFK